MLKSVASKVMWVGRATVFMIGLAVILAMIFGIASAAFAGNGDSWRLGRNNVATAITVLGGELGVDGPMVRLTNNNAGTDDTALSLNVQSGEPPMTVNSSAEVTNLNADKLDGRDASTLMPAQTYTVDETVEMGSNTVGTTRVVFCDEGDVPISGGFSGLGSETQVFSSYRKVHVGRPTWWVSVRKAQGPEDTWTAQAVCADFPPLRP